MNDVLPLLKEHQNHANWKVRLIVAEITERCIGLKLKNLEFDNFGENTYGDMLIHQIKIESDT